MKLSRKKNLDRNGYERTGRKKGYKVTISYSDFRDYFYFTIEKGDEFHNSIWADLTFDTEEECITACEKYIDSL